MEINNSEAAQTTESASLMEHLKDAPIAKLSPAPASLLTLMNLYRLRGRETQSIRSAYAYQRIVALLETTIEHIELLYMNAAARIREPNASAGDRHEYETMREIVRDLGLGVIYAETDRGLKE